MQVLLTNDDGLTAPGIQAMHDALTAQGALAGFGTPLGGTGTRVTTIAPLTVQSATGHGVTFHQPLMVSRVQVNDRMQGVAVDGRPADCVKLAMAAIWQERFGVGSRPDLLISGLNAGANVGINVIYSGTVAAALEGAFLGIPSIAVSLHLGEGGAGKARFDVAAGHARRAIERILEAGLPSAHACLSINVPVTESRTAMPRIAVCPMNTHGLMDAYERRVSPSNDVYYWASGHGLDFHGTDEGSDVQHLLAGRITVTPLWYDLTNPGTLGMWKERLGGWE